MCLHVFTGGRLENLPVPDTPQGAGTAEVNMLDMEKTVLSRQRELPAGKRPPAPRHAPWETSLWKHCPLAVAQQHRDPAVERPRPATRISGDIPPRTRCCPKGTKSTPSTTSTVVSTKGAAWVKSCERLTSL